MMKEEKCHLFWLNFLGQECVGVSFRGKVLLTLLFFRSAMSPAQLICHLTILIFLQMVTICETIKGTKNVTLNFQNFTVQVIRFSVHNLDVEEN